MEYQREGYELFAAMMDGIKETAVPTLEVCRPRDSGGALRQIRVLVDGRPTVGLRPGGSARLAVSTGEHVVQAAMDWARSEPLTVSALDEDDVVVVEVAVPLRAAWQSFIRPSAALDIRTGVSSRWLRPRISRATRWSGLVTVVAAVGLLAVLVLGPETLPRPLVVMLPLVVAAACLSTLLAHMLSRR